MQVSKLAHVQNYTSTSDEIYKETIEARRVREAITKFSNKVKHKPVSIVEKKKQERIFDQIEQFVTNGQNINDFSDSQMIPGEMLGIGAPKAKSRLTGTSSLNESQVKNLKRVLRSPSLPLVQTVNSSNQQQKSLKQVHSCPTIKDIDNRSFCKMDRFDQLPIYEEPSMEALNTPFPFRPGTLRDSNDKENANVPVTDDFSRTVADLNIAPKMEHKALDVLMKKAAKFDRESLPVLE